MNVIHKRPFDSNGTGQPQQVMLPPGARPVGAGWQDGPVVWYTVPVDEVQTHPSEWEEWTLQFTGTGQPFDSTFEYIGVPIQMPPYVFHLVGRRG